MVDKDAVIDGYDDVATTYIEDRSLDRPERQALSALLDRLSADSRVLDAGCGGGKPILQELTSHSQQALGLDFSTAQLELAASNAPDAGLLRGDMTQLPLADSSLDGVLAYHSLIHIPAEQHQTVIDEFARILRPGGTLLVSEGPGEWEGENPDWLDTGAEMQWYIAGADTTRTQLETAGFQIRTEYRTSETRSADEEEWIFFDATLEAGDRD